MSTRRRLAFLAAAALCLAPLTATAQREPRVPEFVGGETTVILVRHAEKESGDDPALTDAGRARVEALVRMLADVGVTAVYATPTRRTRDTAAPLARAHRLEVQELPVDDGYAAAQAKKLRESPAGSLSVVVSHSNTVPAILAALGVPKPPPIADDRFDDLFIVALPYVGTPTVLHLHYGQPSGG